MQMVLDFAVPVPLREAWHLLLDLKRVGELFPGATVTGTSEDAVVGKLRLRAGATQVTYQGEARIASQDEAAHRAVVELHGTEVRGAGTAMATIIAELAGVGDSTRIDLRIDLALTGRLGETDSSVLGPMVSKLIRRFTAVFADGTSTRSVEAPSAASTSSQTPATAGRAPSRDEMGRPVAERNGDQHASQPPVIQRDRIGHSAKGAAIAFVALALVLVWLRRRRH